MREVPSGPRGIIHASLRLCPRLLNWSCRLSSMWSAGDASWPSVVFGRALEDREHAPGRRRGGRVREDAAGCVAQVLDLLVLGAPPLERREAVVASFAEAARQRRDYLDRREVLVELVLHLRQVVAEVAVLEQFERRDDLVDVGRADRRILHEGRFEEARDTKALDLAGALAEHLLFEVRVDRRDGGPRARLAHEGGRASTPTRAGWLARPR